MSYSQNDEEAAILAVLGPRAPGRFLDIGAHDGVSLSNTRALAELGWTGTLVEPSPAAFCKLMDTYRDNPKMALVHAAVIPGDAGHYELLKMHDARGDYVSTFDEAHRHLWATQGNQGKGVPFQPIYVAGFVTGILLEYFPGPYQFINLDVEGINWPIFLDLPLRALEAEVVCVEYQHKLAEMVAHATAQGYRQFHVTSENVLFVRQ